MSYYDDFLPFKRLLKKDKKLKFSMTADLQRNVVFALFTLLQILQLICELLHFRCPEVIL